MPTWSCVDEGALKIRRFSIQTCIVRITQNNRINAYTTHCWFELLTVDPDWANSMSGFAPIVGFEVADLFMPDVIYKSHQVYTLLSCFSKI